MNKQSNYVVMDGNEATAYVAFHTNEVIALYPITPSSGMGEMSDSWAASGKTNIWGTVPLIIEMQSEGGAAGAIHGSLQGGALSTTFTASQGLLLMIPNMYKIAGELTSTVFHVSARTVATHALSIFGDHSDVMACRQIGWALMPSGSIQEALDLALIAQASTLESRVPFLHFFEGFRVSHEINKIDRFSTDVMKAMLDDNLIAEHRKRALNPDSPVLRGTAQNPDVFMQARERCQPYYLACPSIVQKYMDKFATLTGRQYHLFDYYGDPNAEQVIVIMGSGGETVLETVKYLNTHGYKVGVIKVRLYRPFDLKAFVEAIPATVKSIAVLDRTKESGALGEPLYTDCVAAIYEGLDKGINKFKHLPKLVGGRYGLSSKEFTPAMVKAVFDNLKLKEPKNHFTVGIKDDVSNTSLDYDPEFSIESSDTTRGLFFGLGSDGTVSANKNSIKIIAENTSNYAQGYFVYDSKKAGAMTVSHLRFGPRPIRSPYLIKSANFIACHQTVFLERYDMLQYATKGAIFLLNAPWDKNDVWNHLPRKVQKDILDKDIKFYVIDAYKVAQQTGMGFRINTIMQTCFFAISGVLPKEQAIDAIKNAIRKTYGKKGEEIVNKNIQAIDKTLEHLFMIETHGKTINGPEMPPLYAKSDKAPQYVKDVLSEIYAGRGDNLPVSAFSPDGTFPTATARWEKRNIALEIPVWDPQLCLQCGKCSIVCPHAAIRPKVYEEKWIQNAPKTFKFALAKDKVWKEKGMYYTLQIAPEDCTGCGVCVSNCPAKDKIDPNKKAINMQPQMPLRAEESKNWDYFLQIPPVDRTLLNPTNIRFQQLQEPLFEFSGACAGCGETPYVKLLSELFGDRAVIANATGCSSIYGGNLPTTPWSINYEGRGPAWSNSLFEDNAEFGLGLRLAIDKQAAFARELLTQLSSKLGDNIVSEILNNSQSDDAQILKQRNLVKLLKEKLISINEPQAKQLFTVADNLIKRSVWIVGGDGWAYDIGYGGLDHVLLSGYNINVLVLDTEVYSNTGGQCSKATPRSAVAKFAEGGKRASKKDLGAICMTYTNTYVASVALGAKDVQAVKAFVEAEAYNGPSIIIAYCPCIAHGIDMKNQLSYQNAVVASGRWILYRYNPDLVKENKNPLQLDSKKPSMPVKESLMMENRFKMLTRFKPEEAEMLHQQLQKEVDYRWQWYEYLSQMPIRANN